MSQDELTHELLKERRRSRFWKNVRFMAGVGVFVAVFTSMTTTPFDSGDEGGPTEGPHVAMVEIEGVIGGPGGTPTDRVLEGLDSAFEAVSEAEKESQTADDLAASITAPEPDRTEEGTGAEATSDAPESDASQDAPSNGVMIRINSPGGSPVQSHRIYERIRDFKADHPGIPVVVYGAEMLASGAYYAAAAGDRIHVSPATVTGSIGVVMQAYQYRGLLEWLKIKPRLVTAGKHKDRLAGTREWTEADRQKMKGVVDQIHRQFIDAVKAGRGDRLQTAKADLFSGDFWVGERAKALGLVDGLGTFRSVLEAEFDTTTVVDYTPQPGWRGMLDKVTTTLTRSITQAIQDQGTGSVRIPRP